MAVAIAQPGSCALAPDDRERLEARAREAVARARTRGGPVVAAITVLAAPGTDPTAVVCASRGAGERWFCWEQPERDGTALAALGSVHALEAGGRDRFGAVAEDWRRLAAGAVVDEARALVAVGGFAFADDGGRSPAWEGFPPACLTIPEVALARRGDEVRVTFAAAAAPDDTPADVVARVQRRAAELRSAPLPLLDPAHATRARVSSDMPPEHYVEAVARAVERIRRGELEKVVLARAVEVHAAAAHDPGAILGVLREAFPGCYVVAAGMGEATLVMASPELLVRRDGARASTVALAGSTRRSADPAVDDHLGEQLLRSDKDRSEQAIVAREIRRTLARRAVWVTAAPEPVVVRMANIQHLATPIRAQLAEPVGAIDLVGLLHPTPAVGGEPRERAVAAIPALEGLDRGWYAGPVGWTDAGEDGEFCVALRCAVLRGGVARCFAGVGVVRDSDPAAELAETEIKLEALLPVLAA